jgi:hypothetical protein
MLPDGIPGLAECYLPLRGLSFREFALWATSQPVETDAVDIHIRACSWWLRDGETSRVDKVYRLGNIKRGWDELRERFGFPQLAHLNKSFHLPWINYVTQELDDRIKQAYVRDYDRWYRNGPFEEQYDYED